MEGLEGIIYLAIIAFMFGGGFSGFGFGGGAGAAMAGNMATQNDVQRGFDAMNLQNQSRDILGAVNMQGQASIAATNQAFHDNLAAMQNLYNETARDVAALAVGQSNIAGDLAKCCCDIKQLIAATSAETNANIAQAKFELSSKMDAMENQRLRDENYKLQLQNAMIGVMKFPTSYAYNGGQFPPAAATA